MFVTRGNILSLISSTKISYKEKESIIKKNDKLLKKVLQNANPNLLVEYLFDGKIPKSVKKIIKTVIEDKSNNYEFNKKLKHLFQQHQGYKESDLFKSHFPDVLKSYIVKYLYNGDILEILNSNKKDQKLKELIILYGVNDNLLAEFLSSSSDKELIKYCLENKFKDSNNIAYVLYSEKISVELKEHIIKRFINEDNIFEVLKKPSTEEIKNKIIELKKEELFQKIINITEVELKDLITCTDLLPKIIYDMLLKEKKSMIINLINKMSFNEFKKTLINIKNIKIFNMIIKNFSLKTKMVLANTSDINVLSWIYNDSIPYEIKEFIMDKKEPDLKLAINGRSIANLKICYLRNSKNIPMKIQTLILELKKDELLLDLKKKPSSIIISEILYGNYCDLYKMFLIKNGEFDLKELLERSNEELTTLVFDAKKEYIKNIILNMSLKELVILEVFPTLFSKELAVFQNKELILKKIINEKKEDLYTYLKSYETHREIKKLILKSMDINENDLDNCVELINYTDVELVVKNYNKIKSFINKSGINFDAFVQYGSGSENYKDWFKKVIEIIEFNKEEDFFASVKYLMNELFHEDQNKENMVYSIINYLTIIDAFKDCYYLIMNLVHDNVLLDKENSDNLKRLFASSYNKKNEVRSLNDIKTIRIKILEQYKDPILKTSSIEELKTIFMDVICQKASKNLNYIGGTKTLLTLKEVNKSNKKFTEFTDELLKFSKVIDAINNTNNIETLRSLLKYFIIEHPENLLIIESSFINFQKNIQKLFEIDAKLNLTKLDSEVAKSLITSELSQKYGGVVYDFSKVNYCLYAHILSRSENVEDLINGEANSKRNFLSVSPVSYLGQKYYFDRTSPTFAIDNILTGSFIHSSLINMGTNYNIKNNSVEVKELNRTERGILETSAVTMTNSEVLLYREGIKVGGIILPGGRIPSEEELLYHEKYNLPFIITQNPMETINNVKKIFDLNEVEFSYTRIPKELDDILNTLTTRININKKSNIYTGREIAIITDAHSLYEPTLAVLEEIRKNGITEIYSLGDNVGEGPNPHEVLGLLEDYNVKSTAGNSEYYNILGIEPFTYFDDEKRENQEWTYNKLSASDIKTLKLYKPSIDLSIGNQNVALCHFANDIRWDYLGNNSTWAYQRNFKAGSSSKQFLYTNSKEANRKIEDILSHANLDDPKVKGFIDALNTPLFDGKKVTDYDAVIQGHVHFALNDKLFTTKIASLRAVGMGHAKNDYGDACYYVLKEKCDGSFDIEKRLVDFNKNVMLANIVSSDIPHKEKILRFVR